MALYSISGQLITWKPLLWKMGSFLQMELLHMPDMLFNLLIFCNNRALLGKGVCVFRLQEKTMCITLACVFMAGKQQGQSSKGERGGKWEQFFYLYCQQQPGPAQFRWSFACFHSTATHQPSQVNMSKCTGLTHILGQSTQCFEGENLFQGQGRSCVVVQHSLHHQCWACSSSDRCSQCSSTLD